MPPEAPDKSNDSPLREPRFTRRRLLIAGSGLFIGGSAGAAYARFFEPFWPAIERLTLDLPGLHDDLVGCSAVQLSDLHVGRDVPAEYLRRQMHAAMSLRPDLILLTGDYVTAGSLRFREDLAALLAILEAPLGVYAVLGNHDCGSYSPQRRKVGPGLADRVHEVLAETGIVVLRNERAVVARGAGRFQLVGVDDLWSGLCDVERAFAGCDERLPTVTLAHNPDTIELLRERPTHWVLCGHTHGGQVRVPFFGPLILPVRDRRYDAGLIQVGDQRLYVNRGIGFLEPVRFNCRPEITLFTLARRA